MNVFPMRIFLVVSFITVAFVSGFLSSFLCAMPLPASLEWISGMLILVVYLSFLLALPGNKVVQALIHGADQISNGNLKHRVALPKVGVPREFVLLAERFNFMAEQLQNSNTELRELNAKLEEKIAGRTAEVLRRNRALSILNTLSNALVKSMEFQAILTETVETARNLFQADLGAVVSFESPQPACLVWNKSDFFASIPDPTPDELRDSFSHDVVSSGRVVVIDDLAPFARRMRGRIGQSKMRSLLVAPIRGRTQVIASLTMASRFPGHFHKEDIQLLESIGSQLGIAMENAKLFEQLRREHLRSSSIIESIGEGMLLVQDRKVRYCNQTLAAMFGLDLAGVVGGGSSDVYRLMASRCTDEEKTFSQLANLERSSDATVNFETVIQKPQSKYVSLRSFPVMCSEGDCLGYGMLVRDITREKELDQLKSSLISTVSHEIRTPLTSIKGYATSLLRKDVEWDKATRQEFIQEISEECDRLKRLVDNILDMSRIEGGMLALSYQEVRMEQLIIKCVHLAEKRYPGYIFELFVEPELPGVQLDEGRIQQVMANLLDNAVKYSAGEKQINVCTRLVAEEVVVSVSDRGIGIPDDQVPHVFNRFHRADNSGTTQGVGLGLAICRGIISAHGGRIWLESSPGLGSTFNFALPIKARDRGSRCHSQSDHV